MKGRGKLYQIGHMHHTVSFKLQLVCSYYKSWQAIITNRGSFLLLQIVARVITNRGSWFITNRGKCYYISWQLLQIVASLLQIVAGITNRGNYYKTWQNNPIRNYM